MSYKDRSCSPVLLESGLKSFLGTGHNYPLINVCGSEKWIRTDGRSDVLERSSGVDQNPPVDAIPQRSNSKPAHGGHGHSAIKDLTSGVLGGTPSQDDKSKDDSELWCNVEAQTAFLGPNLWDKTYETDLKYVDLDEFLSENGVSMDGSGGPLGGLGTSAHSLPKRERSPSPSDCMSPDTLNPPSPADSSTDLTTTNSFSSNSQHSGKPLNFNFFYETLSMASSGRDFDPRTRAFSDEELKPQPMIKKSRKQFVPDNLKDDKYWARRRKNNMAAKRSRDARRMKENQIALRAGYLEKENLGLRQELERLKKENLLLLDKLSKCADA